MFIFKLTMNVQPWKDKRQGDHHRTIYLQASLEDFMVTSLSKVIISLTLPACLSAHLTIGLHSPGKILVSKIYLMLFYTFIINIYYWLYIILLYILFSFHRHN